MRIKDILKVENIAAKITAIDKQDLIQKMVESVKNSPFIVDYDKILVSVLEREKIISTGVGHGFAFPHAKTNSVSDVIVAFATTTEPVDYQSLDGSPVSLVFLLLCREEQVDIHIKLLSRVSRLMNEESFRTKLLSLKTPQEIFDLFIITEQTILIH
ncbi:MAG: PTS sugar transporter subunit IIA [Ignavibacteria bacterium]|nr:PTS sugar transporter subunit IIA [Bacteroidota bacterium]MSQ46025.1 PTS sugar transporter subunit IIA [Ignavibacteria bacterium]